MATDLRRRSGNWARAGTRAHTSGPTFKFTTEAGEDNIPTTIVDPEKWVKSIVYSATGIYTITISDAFGYLAVQPSLSGAIGDYGARAAVYDPLSSPRTIVVSTQKLSDGSALSLVGTENLWVEVQCQGSDDTRLA